MKVITTILLGMLLPLLGQAWAGLNEGIEAYKRGDYSAALGEWQILAKKGNAIAQYNLAVMYGHGQGLQQDDIEAVKWYKMAAEQGHAPAQRNLGVAYSDGEGVQQDDKEAAKWFRLAAEQGDAEMQRNMGVLYYNGEGVQQDYKEAEKWFRMAAEQDEAKAQRLLGVLYYNGHGGVTRNYREAMKWTSKAADQGEVGAKRDLKTMYEGGLVYTPYGARKEPLHGETFQSKARGTAAQGKASEGARDGRQYARDLRNSSIPVDRTACAVGMATEAESRPHYSQSEVEDYAIAFANACMGRKVL